MKALYIIIGVLLLAYSVVGYTVVDSTQKTLIFHPDGSFDAVSGIPSGGLQAGDTSSGGWILIIDELGVYEYIPASQNYALEGIGPMIPFASSTECQTKCTTTYADSVCRSYGYVLGKASSSQPVCSGSTCKFWCDNSGTICTSNSQCVATQPTSCGTCWVGSSTCTSGSCVYRKCGTAAQCGSQCSDEATAQAWCFSKLASNSRSIKSASCSITNGVGTAVCVTMEANNVPCTTNSQCLQLAIDACTYGYSSYGCNKEYNCLGNVAWSTCFRTCKQAPLTPVDGVCSLTIKDTCTKGVFTDIADTATQYKWQCAGTNGGATVTCSQNIQGGGGTIVNGMCGLVQKNSCQAGTLSDIPDTATAYKWQCVGSGGGGTVTCTQTIINPTCGDGACTGTESAVNCPSDCATQTECGNGICESGENVQNCLLDCGPIVDPCTPGFQGTAYCQGTALVQEYQYGDCSKVPQIITQCDHACVNGACSDATQSCGNGVCEADLGETTANCPGDCNIQPFCGDGVCQLNIESKETCKQDCCTGISCGIINPPLDLNTWLWIGGGVAVVALLLALFWLMRRK